MSVSPLHKSPTLIACASFIIGIILNRYFYVLSSKHLYIALFIVIFLIALFQFIKIKRRTQSNIFYLILLVSVFILSGIIRYRQVDKQNEFDGIIKAKFTGTLLKAPIKKEKSYRVDLLIDSAYTDSSSFAIATQVIAYIEKSPEVLNLLPGHRIKFESKLAPPSGKMNPEDFDYKEFLKRKSVFATCYISKENWQTQKDERLSLKIWAARIQNHVVNIIKELNFDKAETALLSALTVGYKQMIDKNQRYAYVASGATHVLAVSGLHVGIIFLFLSRIFKFLEKDRKTIILRTIIIIVLLWCFALITGLTPSVIRATLMFSLVSLGSISKQRSNIFNTIYLSAFIILTINPHLLFDLGFQLSYSAVLAIVAFEPYISKFLKDKIHLPRFLAELIALSIAAQIGTAPITIHHFNCFPSYFILTNIWIIPLVGLILQVAIIIILLALVGIPVNLIAIPLNWLLKGMNLGVKLISQLPYSLTNSIYFDSVTMVLIYLSVVMLIFALDYHSKYFLTFSITFIISALMFNIYQLEKQKEETNFFVFNDHKVFNIAAQQGLKSDILLERDSMETPSYFIHHYIARRSLNSNYLNKKYYKNNNLQYYNEFIITPQNLHAIYSPKLDLYSGNIAITSLIINKKEPENIYRMYKHIKFKTLVLFRHPEKSLTYYKNFCKKNDIKLHLVYKDGAYIARL